MKPVALVAKQLAARLVFLSTLIILLPLAVLNRQTVSIALNPMDLLRDVPHGRLEMPLFIALFALFIDRINCDGCLTSRAVTNDELTLATTDRNH